MSLMPLKPGTPALDGFGHGGGWGTEPEVFTDLSTLTPRAYLLARVLMDFGLPRAAGQMGSLPGRQPQNRRLSAQNELSFRPFWR